MMNQPVAAEERSSARSYVALVGLLRIPIAAQLGLEVSVKPLVKKEAKLEIIRG